MFQRIAKPFRISIHALLAESDNDAIDGCNPDLISIHALLAESDAVTRVASTPTTVISIHALLAESDANQTNSPKKN